jgi:hypothetical protein
MKSPIIPTRTSKPYTLQKCNVGTAGPFILFASPSGPSFAAAKTREPAKFERSTGVAARALIN